MTPGRCEVDLVLARSRGSFHGELGGRLHGFATLLAREGVGVARVDYQDARLAALEALPAPQDRGRARLRLRQHAGRRRARIGARRPSGRRGSCNGFRPRRRRGERPRSPACRQAASGQRGDFGNVVGHGSTLDCEAQKQKPRSGARLAGETQHAIIALALFGRCSRRRRMCSRRFVMAPTSALC